MLKRKLTPSFKHLGLLFISAACALTFHAHALPAMATQTAEDSSATSTIAQDFDLPVTLTSNHQAIDGKKKTSIFTENVVIRQGSLELLADRVELDATNGKRQEVIIASGSPASYKQRLEDGTIVEARANKIVYTVASRTLSLRGQAVIVQNDVKVDGDSILFDMAKEQILAESDENSSGPVTTVISPGAFSQEKSDSEQQ